jgi:hypothetical protein
LPHSFAFTSLFFAPLGGQDTSQVGLDHPSFLVSTLRDDKIDGMVFNFFCFFLLDHDPLVVAFVDGMLNADINPPIVELRDESVLPHADDAELLALSDVTSLFPL